MLHKNSRCTTWLKQGWEEGGICREYYELNPGGLVISSSGLLVVLVVIGVTFFTIIVVVFVLGFVLFEIMFEK